MIAPPITPGKKKKIKVINMKKHGVYIYIYIYIRTTSLEELKKKNMYENYTLTRRSLNLLPEEINKGS